MKFIIYTFFDIVCFYRISRSAQVIGQLTLDSVMEFLESSMAQQRSLFQHMIDVFANTVLNTTNEQIRVLDENMKQNSEILTGNRQILSEQLGLTNVYLEQIARAFIRHVFERTSKNPIKNVIFFEFSRKF